MNNLISYKEFRQRISILDLALANGYVIDKRKGRRWPVLKNSSFDDTVIIINPDESSNQGYFNPRNDLDKGTIVEFIKNRLGSVFATPFQSDVKNINEVLYNSLKLDFPGSTDLYTAQPSAQFNAQGLAPLKDISWLETRGLCRDTVYGLEFSNRIFNQQVGNYINTCFPYFDHKGIIIACESRNSGYKMQFPGGDRSKGIWHSNIPMNLRSVILTESPVDAISYQQLKGGKDSLYISFGGSIGQGQIETLKVIIEDLEKCPDFVMLAGFDIDKQGEKYSNKVREHFPLVIRDCPTLKDFNEDLCNKRRQISQEIAIQR
jgi:hypothetical protein